MYLHPIGGFHANTASSHHALLTSNHWFLLTHFLVGINAWKNRFSFSCLCCICPQFSGSRRRLCLTVPYMKNKWMRRKIGTKKFFSPLLATRYPKVPTSITPSRLNWFPSCSEHCNQEPQEQIQLHAPTIFTGLFLCNKPRGHSDDWCSGKCTESDFSMFHPSGVAFSCFHDELTDQRKLLVISVLHCQTVLCLIKVIKASEQISLLSANKWTNMLIVLAQLDGLR